MIAPQGPKSAGNVTKLDEELQIIAPLAIMVASSDALADRDALTVELGGSEGGLHSDRYTPCLDEMLANPAERAVVAPAAGPDAGRVACRWVRESRRHMMPSGSRLQNPSGASCNFESCR